jgi:hypothetical protein
LLAVAGLVWAVAALAVFLLDTLELPVEVLIPSLLAVVVVLEPLRLQTAVQGRILYLVTVLANQISQQLVVVMGQQIPTALAAIRGLLEVLVVLVAEGLHRIKVVGLLVAPASKAKAMQVGMLDTLARVLVALAVVVRVLLRQTV